jgi:hypothetical protein
LVKVKLKYKSVVDYIKLKTQKKLNSLIFKTNTIPERNKSPNIILCFNIISFILNRLLPKTKANIKKGNT